MDGKASVYRQIFVVDGVAHFLVGWLVSVRDLSLGLRIIW